MRSILRTVSRPRLVVALTVVLSLSGSWTRADDKVFTQKPEVVASQTRGESGKAVPLAVERAELLAGPPATWIWGPDADLAYVLRKEFPGDAKGARLIAAADNRMTIYLNGKRVASGDNWQEPVELDVTKALKDGRNELLVEVANAGGPSGFALKLAITRPDGRTRYVVSDRSWQAAASRDSKQWDAVRMVARMGDQPWGDVFTGTQPIGRVPREVFETLPGYQVERLFTVPRDQLGLVGLDHLRPQGPAARQRPGR